MVRMDRLVSVNSLERYAVVLENGHKYIPWVALAEVPTAEVGQILELLVKILGEHTDGSLDRWFLDLQNLHSLLQRPQGENL